VAYLSANVIKAAIHHFTDVYPGVEKENKKLLIHGSNYEAA
jgi:hypothetical protein